MVTKENIIEKLLQNSGKITPEDSMKIQKIIREYPYFQQAYVFQTLYLKNNHSFYKSILQETAARTTDRRRLYEIMEVDNKKKPEKKIEKKAVETTENAITHAEIPNKIKAKSTTEIKETPKIEKQLKKKTKKKLIKKKKKTKKKKKKTKTKKKKTPKKKKQQKKKTKEKLNKASGRENKTAGSKQTQENRAQTDDDKADPEKHYFHSETTRFVPENEQKLSYLEWLQQLNSPKKTKKSEIFDAIDKFLKERPKIVPQRDKSVEPPDIIEKSIEERQTLMTETLANLYIKQKKYHKAIQAFKILSLKYPKKSSYFANRIKELKQKLK